MSHGPASDAEVARWISSLGIDGLVDIHLHFLPKPVMDKVWAYFDQAEENYGTPWPVHYRTAEEERLDTLRAFGVRRFAPLVYPHKPGMAEWLTSWALEFAERVPDAVPTGTFYPEPSAVSVVDGALRAGARCFKAHVQVGAAGVRRGRSRRRRATPGPWSATTPNPVRGLVAQAVDRDSGDDDQRRHVPQIRAEH